LLALTGCGTVAASNGASPQKPVPLPVSKAQRFHPNMSKVFRVRNDCDETYMSVREIVSYVGKPADGRVAARVRVTAIGKPRWNTSDGHRPTQAESNVMVDQRNDEGVLTPGPHIFTPITFRIEHVYAGAASGTVVGFAQTGRIGGDEEYGCQWGSPTRLQIRESEAVVTVGKSYIAIIGDEVVTGRTAGPLDQPIIDRLYVIRGDKVIGLNETPESLPQAAPPHGDTNSR
jgi:hypothetical protein